jgi:hypothetical protein
MVSELLNEYHHAEMPHSQTIVVYDKNGHTVCAYDLRGGFAWHLTFDPVPSQDAIDYLQIVVGACGVELEMAL